jgi:hypothetical protein
VESQPDKSKSPDRLPGEVKIGRFGAIILPAMRSRIMYIEAKGEDLTGPARIGRVTFSKSGRTIYYAGKAFQSLGGNGFKANFFDVATSEQYWISGPRRDGADALYTTNIRTPIDEDVREEYWTEIRKLPSKKKMKTT